MRATQLLLRFVRGRRVTRRCRRLVLPRPRPRAVFRSVDRTRETSDFVAYRPPPPPHFDRKILRRILTNRIRQCAKPRRTKNTHHIIRITISAVALKLLSLIVPTIRYE